MQDTMTGSAPRTFVIWGVALLAALWLAMTAAGSVLAANAPGAALMVQPAAPMGLAPPAAEPDAPAIAVPAAPVCRNSNSSFLR